MYNNKLYTKTFTLMIISYIPIDNLNKDFCPDFRKYW